MAEHTTSPPSAHAPDDDLDTPLARAGTDVYAEASRLREAQDRVQQKTFTKWWNSYLKERGLKLDDLFKGVADGVMLANLLEILGNARLEGKIDKQPRFAAQKLSNLEICWAYLKSKIDPKAFLSIGPNDIASENQKLILGLTWQLILRFEIQKFSADIQELLRWVKKRTHGYSGVHVDNFTSSFQDGLTLNALIHAHFPELINYDSLDKSQAVQNLNNAFDVAEKHLGVPKLLDAVDVASDPDEKSMITYLARLRQAMNDRDEALRKKDAEVEARRRATAEEEEARRKAAAEEEARRKAADEEARRKAAEDEARRRAEEEARRKAAEEEARRLAEEEARRQAELAAQQAKEEARRRALDDLKSAMPIFMERAAHESETDRKNKDFDALAGELADWIKAKARELQGNENYRKLDKPEDVQALLARVVEGKHPGEHKLLEAHALANELETRAQLEGRPQPAHPIGIRELSQDWDGLEHVYDGYKAGLLEHLHKLQGSQSALDRIRRYLQKLSQWHQHNEADLRSTDVGASLVEVTALIAKHDRLARDAQSELASLKHVDELAATVRDKPADIVADLAGVHVKFDPLHDLLTRRARDLQQLLERQRALEAQRVAFYEATKQFGQHVFDAEEVVNHPLPGDTEASLRTLADTLVRFAATLGKVPEGADAAEATALLERYRAIAGKLDAMRNDLRAAGERKQRVDEAQRKYAKAAQHFQTWYQQQTLSLESAVPSLDVLRVRVQTVKGSLPEGQSLLTSASAADGALSQMGAAGEINPHTSLTLQSLEREYSALRKWAEDRAKLVDTGLPTGDRPKVVRALDVLADKKGSVTHAELESYLPAPQAALLETKLRPTGSETFVYGEFAPAERLRVTTTPTSSPAAATGPASSSAAYGTPLSPTNVRKTSLNLGGGRRSDGMLASPTSTHHISNYRELAGLPGRESSSGSVSGTSTSTSSGAGAPSLQLPTTFGSPSSYVTDKTRSTESPQPINHPRSPSASYAQAAAVAATSPPPPAAAPGPRFLDSQRVRKTLEDGIFLLTTKDAEDKLIRYEIDNPTAKRVDFKISFEGSVNVKVIQPETSSLEASVVIEPHTIKTVAVLLPQVDRYASASTRVRYSWLLH